LGPQRAQSPSKLLRIIAIQWLFNITLTLSQSREQQRALRLTLGAGHSEANKRSHGQLTRNARGNGRENPF
jgi:hypothetical protein